ncbi:MAG TPA: class I SAM-dependent methyltransferase [Gemmatimonadales bacterium]|nr:class I SAM-dependent methyltransferase [Gemmatimonadales bacterium]
MDHKSHWERIYRTKLPTQVSWYQPHVLRSLDLIRRVRPPPNGGIIDVGGGASTLIDDLLDGGYHDLTVLDLSATALAESRTRLGARAGSVRWIEADILNASLPQGRYSIWHDRAVFHFLTEPADRASYIVQVRRAVRPGGFVLVASFADDGPTRCSGLDVHRYSPETLHAEFGSPFRLIASEREEHITPAGVVQAFIYCLCHVDSVNQAGE